MTAKHRILLTPHELLILWNDYKLTTEELLDYILELLSVYLIMNTLNRGNLHQLQHTVQRLQEEKVDRAELVEALLRLDKAEKIIVFLAEQAGLSIEEIIAQFEEEE